MAEALQAKAIDGENINQKDIKATKLQEVNTIVRLVERLLQDKQFASVIALVKDFNHEEEAESEGDLYMIESYLTEDISEYINAIDRENAEKINELLASD